MQVRRHLERLIDLEYVSLQSGRNGMTMSYCLIVDVKESSNSYHVGLLDVAKLREKEAEKKSA